MATDTMEKPPAENTGASIDPVDQFGVDRIAWNIVSSWAAYVVFVVAGFIMPRLIDRHLGNAALGVWDLGWSLVSYLGLTSLGIGSGVNRFVAWYRSQKEADGVSRVVSSVLFVQIIAAAGAAGVTVAATAIVPSLLTRQLGTLTGETRWVVLLLGLAICVQMGFDPFRGVITGCHRWDLHNYLNAGFYAAIAVGMVTALQLRGGLRSLALVYLCGAVLGEITRAAVAFRVYPGLRLRWGYVSYDEIRRMFAFGSKSILLSASTLLLYQSNSMLIAAYLGPGALALYSRPMALMRHVTTIVSKFGHVLVPTASGLDADGRRAALRELMLQSGRFGAYVTLPMVCWLAIMGDPFLEVWMGPLYKQGLVLAILAVGQLVPLTHEPMINILTAMNGHGRVALANLIGAVGGVGLGVVTIGYLGWGLAGAAICVTLPLVITRGIYVAFSGCRRLGLPLRQYVIRTSKGPLICAIPFVLCVATARVLFAARPLQALGWGGIVGAIILTRLYWRVLLPRQWRERFKRHPVGKAIHRAREEVNAAGRSLVVSLFRWSGFLWLWRFLHRHDVIILTVHGTLDSDNHAPWRPLRRQLPPRRLEASIRFLSKYYRFVSLHDAVGMVSGRVPVRPYSLALTFDDGYRNNLKHALPILRRYGVSATFFVVTGHIENRQPFWFDRLDYALQHSVVADCELRVGQETIRFHGADRGGLRSWYKRLRDEAKVLRRPDTEMLREMEGLAAMLEAKSGRKLAEIFEHDDASVVMTWEEIRGAVRDGISFGSHTVDHIRLGLVDAEMVRNQVIPSKQMIERHTGLPCPYLAYPNGSFSPEVAEVARACGYAAAFTATPGVNRVGDDPMTLQRIDLPNSDDLIGTLAVVSGLESAVVRFKKRIRVALDGG